MWKTALCPALLSHDEVHPSTPMYRDSGSHGCKLSACSGWDGRPTGKESNSWVHLSLFYHLSEDIQTCHIILCDAFVLSVISIITFRKMVLLGLKSSSCHSRSRLSDTGLSNHVFLRTHLKSLSLTFLHLALYYYITLIIIHICFTLTFLLHTNYCMSWWWYRNLPFICSLVHYRLLRPHLSA